jgi:hypothetical protein
MILTFGQHRGEDTSSLPDHYLMWLADQREIAQVKGTPWQKNFFKIGAELELEARKELERRGFKKHGLRWVKEE